jgi:hypothetical protein
MGGVSMISLSDESDESRTDQNVTTAVDRHVRRGRRRRRT